MATIFHGVRGAAEAGAAIVSGEVDGQAVEVAVPASALRDADGQPLDQQGCLEVCLPALERQASGEAQPWDAESEDGDGEARSDEEYLCNAADCPRSQPGHGWKTERGRDDHEEAEHSEE